MTPASPAFVPSERFHAAIRAFDEANARDPNRDRDAADGSEHPRELLYARRLTDWVLRLRPDASEPLRLAARCQHLCRWEIPRSSYPADKPGYHRWKRDLLQFHARRAAELLTATGHDTATIARVQALNLKQNLATDPECQTIEDALCLVFLEFQLSDLAARTEEDKLVNAIRKSWSKMSPAARDAALALPLGAREKALVGKALASTPPPAPPAPPA